MTFEKILERVNSICVLPQYSDKLKPCPFCGSKADVIVSADGGWGVACRSEKKNTTCRAMMALHFGDAELAIEHWNRRV